jgi:hypothetical protein
MHTGFWRENLKDRKTGSRSGRWENNIKTVVQEMGLEDVGVA